MKNKNLTPFKRCMLENFPFIEADFDALTNYELMCKIVEYLNSVIEQQNITGQNVNTLLNWFNNLDVQDEINEKLDSMAQSGQLQEIIAEYLNSKAIFGYNTVEDLKSASNLIDGSFAKTMGYNSIGDGGSANYKIREVTNTDIIDEGNLIALNNPSLVAELIKDYYVTPEQYGAYGDGIHDDTVSMQNAINSHDKILINNEYLVNELTNNSNILLYGNGTIIKNSNNNLIYSTNDLTLKDVNIDCNTKNGNCIRIENKNLKLDNVTIKNIGKSSENVNSQYAVSSLNCNEVEILNCYFENIYSNGIHLSTGNKCIIINNTFNNIGNQSTHREGSPIYVATYKYITIDNNILNNSTDSSIYVDKATSEEVTITNNKIDGCGKEGIKNQTQALRTIIANNIIKNCINSAIIITGASQTTNVNANIIENCCINGDSRGTRYGAISILESFSCSITNNIIKFCDLGNARGISVFRTSKQLLIPDSINISNNIIDTIGGIPIWCQECNNIKITDNLLKNSCLTETAWKVGVYLAGCNGVVNNNLIPENNISIGDCLKISSNKIKLPSGFPSVDLNGANILLNLRSDAQDVNDEQLNTTIVSYDSTTKEVTLSDNINFINTSNELVFNITLSTKLQYGFRLYNNDDVIMVGNSAKSTIEFVRIDTAGSVTTFPTSLSTMNKYNKIV